MKIEKVNENQIRCTLTREDLADRELKISELAYGTEKAKNLFRDMMQQASFECGFEAEDIPLMIEAIPLNSECIVLIITKVEDPEELDTRFSKFAPSVHDEEDESDESIDDNNESDDDVLDLFKKLHDNRKAAAGTLKQPAVDKQKTPAKADGENTETSNLTRIFVFNSLHGLTGLAAMLGNHYQGENSLYKDESEGLYLLVISGSGHTPKEFNRICNILSEYGSPRKSIPASLSYLEEHYSAIIAEHALQSLAKI
ncbi:MAG TPA: adaptor protein MecA [Lachnospiraceae bacterium]|nr:adaptor protein MecA [Lachnospiraceae bacterium]